MSNPGEQVSFLIYGPSKKGKSTLANTVPGPRLLLDAEAAGRFLRGKKVRWNPLADAPPAADGSWDICIVVVDEYAKLEKTIEWLESGNHPFESVVVDSISEIQKKLKKKITGSQGLQVKDMEMRLWGKLLSHMSALMEELRDLTEHPTRPVNVVITAMEEMGVDKYMPLVEGSLKKWLPYYMDVVGRVDTTEVASSDPTQPPQTVHYLATRSGVTAEGTPFFAGERVQGRIPQYVYGDDLNLSKLIDGIWADEPVPTA